MHWIAWPLPPDEVLPRGACADLAAAPAAPAPEAGWWALRFTPRVTQVDEALLMEVSSVERLWGGRAALLEQLQRVCPRGPGDAAVVWASGATAFIALALLRLALAGQAPPPAARLPQALPLQLLAPLRPHVASLERMGCRTWGDLQALPRAGVARRFGAAVLQALDQALGLSPQPHAWLALPERFDLSVELPALATSADALLWSANRLLSALQSWLQARQQGVLALELGWRHDLRRIDGVHLPAGQALQVRTAQATQDLTHLRRLLAENLARTTLAAPANQIRLRALETAAQPHRSASLLPPGMEPADPAPGAGQGEALHQLFERLSARLGSQQVQGPVLQSDHRPECMQQWRPAAQALAAAVPATPAQRAASHAALWPAWLLRPPRRLAVKGSRPCYQGLLRLLAGPQRLEAGWWPDAPQADGLAGAKDARAPETPAPAAPALRDYFVAHNDAVGLVWVFRERLGQGAARQDRWFLQGIYG